MINTNKQAKDITEKILLVNGWKESLYGTKKCLDWLPDNIVSSTKF